MKTIVLAYHNIGCAGLAAVIDAGFDVQAVFTHADDPGENIWFDSVAELAAGHGIPVFAPDDINHPLWLERIRDMAPEIIFSFYYRNMVGKELLAVPAAGAMNLHGSLLPKYRGRCPVNWALINGESETGVTLHYMTPLPDDGDIVGRKKVAIAEDDDGVSLHRKLSAAASDLLRELLPLIKAKKAPREPQDHNIATCFGGRSPADGEIDWNIDAVRVRNLIRGVTRPYPGAFSYLGNRKCFIWKAALSGIGTDKAPGMVLSVDPLTIACREGAIEVLAGQSEGGIYMNGSQLAAELNLVSGMRLGPLLSRVKEKKRKKHVLILGANGFIGHHLSRHLLERGGYEVHAMDLGRDAISDLIDEPDFDFREGDISIMREWIEYHVRKCDVVLPLVAIATPAEYVKNPLRVFELDFEENLRVTRYCAKYGKRIVFPSTSEVYGMCGDEEFDENNSVCVLGPIRKQRWIYSCAKQMMDRVIWAYGATRGLPFTLIRPFNWVGPRLDTLDSARIGSSRVITQFILNLVEGTPIRLVDGGRQKRCFTDYKDGIECLSRIIENRDDCCNGKIFNIGNPDNEYSVKELAGILVEKFAKHPLRDSFPPFAGFREIEARAFYGSGYQDVQHRRPSIRQAKKVLGWQPRVSFEESVDETLDYFLRHEVARVGEGG